MYETTGRWAAGPCGQRQNHIGRGAALPRGGVLRKPGRRITGTHFLDTDSRERAGHYDLAKQAVLGPRPPPRGAEACELTLLDTPDMWIFPPRPSVPCRCWIMRCWWSPVRTACRPTPRRSGSCWPATGVPTFVFVNKMDLPGADTAVRLRELRGRFGTGVDFSAVPDRRRWPCSEPLMNEVLENGAASPETVVTAIARRQVFVFFGAALRLDGLRAAARR